MGVSGEPGLVADIVVQSPQAAAVTVSSSQGGNNFGDLKRGNSRHKDQDGLMTLRGLGFIRFFFSFFQFQILRNS